MKNATLIIVLTFGLLSCGGGDIAQPESETDVQEQSLEVYEQDSDEGQEGKSSMDVEHEVSTNNELVKEQFVQ